MLAVAVAQVEESVTIFHNLTNEYVQAKIVPISSTHIQEIELMWKPLLKKENCWDQNLNLNKYLNKPQTYEVYVLEYDSIAQGLIVLEAKERHSRLEEGKNLIYVNLLTVAPWNRGAIQETRNYKGVGTSLLTFAISRSFDLGFLGRIALNSVKEAEKFYEKMPFLVAGSDLFEMGGQGNIVSLKYLEMPEEEAELVMLNLYLTSSLN
ncbi:hypothetical protein NIES2100_17500 [Calothrix sp. NIES-2100]|uniref:GNAT family N-acetyltransferase n=1 Tax=Calothrix sp. NIES-2100 TaxID=1954172 RepID=UPI000B60B6A7|nr:hypothetical protein NIES2100_17500 [Calothrix sp. NIES-2100]